MPQVVDLFTFDNPVFRTYILCSTACLLKMILMSIWTAIIRFKTGSAVTQEDADLLGSSTDRNDDVERIRRMHRNDLENIPVFVLLGAMFVAVNPDPSTAILHLKAFTGARFLHTVAYRTGYTMLRSPCFAVGFFTCISMGVRIITVVW